MTSLTYGSWPLSFVFTDRKGNLLHEDMLGEYVIDGQTKADFLNLFVGEEMTVRLPPGGTAGQLLPAVTAATARLEPQQSMQVDHLRRRRRRGDPPLYGGSTFIQGVNEAWCLVPATLMVPLEHIFSS